MNSRVNRCALAGLSLLLSWFAVGCKSDDRVATVSVKGQLLVDGKPFGPAMIALSLANPSAEKEQPGVIGYVQPDGAFELQTYEPGDGAPTGEYQVTLMASSDPQHIGTAVPAVKPATVVIPESSDVPVSLEVKLETVPGAAPLVGPGVPAPPKTGPGGI
jgi:hypothetical protein